MLSAQIENAVAMLKKLKINASDTPEYSVAPQFLVAPNPQKQNRVPHPALLSRVGGFVEARPIQRLDFFWSAPSLTPTNERCRRF
jgi:hypothetical protein